MRKIFILLLLFTSCYTTRLDDKFIAELEKQDDNLCMQEGVDFDNQKTKVIYWNCRLRVMDERIAMMGDSKGYNIFYRSELKKLRILIKKRVDKETNKIGKEMGDDKQRKDDIYCMNKVSKSENPNDYNECMKEQQQRKEEAILTNEEYLNMKFPDRVIEKAVVKDNVSEDRGCIKYANSQYKLTKCLENIPFVTKCIENIENNVTLRKNNDKVYCIKHSRNIYPDIMAKFDNETKATTNIGPKIAVEELLDLREQERQICIKQRRDILPQYKDSLEEECYNKYINF
ncbi:MAG: hypothetical protein Ta2D_10790 [Rickettsiales bacterium]|nr:MAG: hypothetical protein Ta2D_10790 [Rickettsiales bacterium]